MKKLAQGSILRIPLLQGMGYAYAKYIDLMKLDAKATYPDVINVFDVRTPDKPAGIDNLALEKYLISPIAVAGLAPTLKKGLWEIVGKKELLPSEYKAPDFKGGNSSVEEIEKGDWFIYKEGKLENKKRCRYEDVKYLQPFAASGTGGIEILLTMYFLLYEGKVVEDFFDLNDEKYQWKYKQVLDTPALINGQ